MVAKVANIALTALIVLGSPGSARPDARIPNVVVRTQDGASVRFYDDLVKGKAVLINFMFTSCTSVCPRSTANLVKVQELLGERLGREVLIISVTVDPRTDTPDVLKKYATRYHTRPGWYFVTGRQNDVDLIRRTLGAYDVDESDKTQHTGVLVFGNETTGQWSATPAMADPGTIVRSVTRLLRSSSASR